MRTLRGFIVVLALMVPSAAMADPISVAGMWSPTMTPPSSDPSVLPLESTAFWSNPSWDGYQMGVAYLIDVFRPNLEYLHNSDGTPARFRFADEEQIVNPTFLFGFTSRTGGVFGRNEFGAVTYNSGYGPVMNSWDNGEQFALFRLVDDETTHYFLGIEDILLSEYTDRDYNDYVMTFETQPVPEPGTLLLLGSGMAVLVARQRRAARKARREATN